MLKAIRDTFAIYFSLRMQHNLQWHSELKFIFARALLSKRFFHLVLGRSVSPYPLSLFHPMRLSSRASTDADKYLSQRNRFYLAFRKIESPTLITNGTVAINEIHVFIQLFEFAILLIVVVKFVQVFFFFDCDICHVHQIMETTTTTTQRLEIMSANGIYNQNQESQYTLNTKDSLTI